LWSIFWTNTQSVFSMLLVVHKTSASCWDHIHTVARHGVRKAKKFTVLHQEISCGYNKHMHWVPRSKQVAVQLFTRQCTIHTYMPGANLIQSLKLQAWGSLMVPTWSQYFQ
jgi:hypothetical protein